MCAEEDVAVEMVIAKLGGSKPAASSGSGAKMEPQYYNPEKKGKKAYSTGRGQTTWLAGLSKEERTAKYEITKKQLATWRKEYG